MRIAHTCARCGFDLSRLRAPVEPIYGLPVVVCPLCREAVVRRLHPVQARWRQARAALVSIVVLGATVVVAAIFAGLLIGLSVGLRVVIVRALSRGEVVWLDEEVILIGGLWCGAAVLAGAWLGVMLPHWRWWAILPLWVVALWSAMVVSGAAEMIRIIARGESVDLVSLAWLRWLEQRGAMALMGASIVPMTAGYMVGRLGAWHAGRVRVRRKWRHRTAMRQRRHT